MDEVFDAGLDRLPYKYYTAQHYPHHACEGLNDKNTNLTYYRQHTNGECPERLHASDPNSHHCSHLVREYIGWEQSAVDIAKARDIPVLLTEYNTAACGGTNLSDTVSIPLQPVAGPLISRLCCSSPRPYGRSTSVFKQQRSTTPPRTCTPGSSPILQLEVVSY